MDGVVRCDPVDGAVRRDPVDGAVRCDPVGGLRHGMAPRRLWLRIDLVASVCPMSGQYCDSYTMGPQRLFGIHLPVLHPRSAVA